MTTPARSIDPGRSRAKPVAGPLRGGPERAAPPWEARQYARVPRGIYALGLRAQAIAVYALLVDRWWAGRDLPWSGVTVVSRRELAREAGLTEWQARTGLDELVERGLVRVVSRPGGARACMPGLTPIPEGRRHRDPAAELTDDELTDLRAGRIPPTPGRIQPTGGMQASHDRDLSPSYSFLERGERSGEAPEGAEDPKGSDPDPSEASEGGRLIHLRPRGRSEKSDRIESTWQRAWSARWPGVAPPKWGGRERAIAARVISELGGEQAARELARTLREWRGGPPTIGVVAMAVRASAGRVSAADRRKRLLERSEYDAVAAATEPETDWPEVGP